MGAANCPETPRQKMIGMMYLVLTAMLALNVGQEVLDGYVDVNTNITTTNKILDDRNTSTYEQIDYQETVHPAKVKDLNMQAKEVRNLSDKMINTIEVEKKHLAKLASGGETDDPLLLPKERVGDTNVTGQMLKPTSTKGENLRLAFAEYKASLKALAAKLPNAGKVVSEIEKTILVPSEGEKNPSLWEQRLFESRPVITSITFLTKMQNDVRNMESVVIQHLFGQIGATDLKVNKVEAIVIPSSNYIVQGETFTARVITAAIDTTQKPKVRLEGNDIPDGHYVVHTNRNTTVGKKELRFDVEIVDGDGQTDIRKASVSYQVAAPMATVSATKMNVFYEGVVNPLSLSVPGVPADRVSATASNGTLTKVSTGSYTISPKAGRDCDITVSAEIGGKTVSIGTYTFRVKKLPDPIAYLPNGNSKFTGGAIAKSVLTEASSLLAELKDSDFDAKFNIVSFTLNSFDSMGNSVLAQSDGAKFSSKQKDQIKKLRRGKSVYITQIKAKGPDGSVRSLPAIEVEVN